MEQSPSPLPSVTAQAYRVLERMVVTLELAPGSVVTEGALIERLGLGRTPVREAIQRLAWEGLMEVHPRIGIGIAKLEPANWVHVLAARRGVEVILARSAARLANNDNSEPFLAAAEAMRDAVLAENVMAFLEADKALDEALASVTDNPFAARLAAPLQTHSRRFWFRYRNGAALNESAVGHVAVIQAILNRDVEAAGREADRLITLLSDHAERARELR